MSSCQLSIGLSQTQKPTWYNKVFALKAKAKRLLETAKRAVEIAIETDEQTAMVI